jgi:hypothetical protein
MRQRELTLPASLALPIKLTFVSRWRNQCSLSLFRNIIFCAFSSFSPPD